MELSPASTSVRPLSRPDEARVSPSRPHAARARDEEGHLHGPEVDVNIRGTSSESCSRLCFTPALHVSCSLTWNPLESCGAIRRSETGLERVGKSPRKKTSHGCQTTVDSFRPTGQKCPRSPARCGEATRHCEALFQWAPRKKENDEQYPNYLSSEQGRKRQGRASGRRPAEVPRRPFHRGRRETGSCSTPTRVAPGN